MRNYLSEIRTIESEIAALNEEKSLLYKAAKVDGLDVSALRTGRVDPATNHDWGGRTGRQRPTQPCVSYRWENTKVYFAICETGDLIKVGISCNVKKRLASFATGPTPLRLWFAFDGKRSDESACHKILDRHRVRGEWFRFNPEVRAICGRICLDKLGSIEARALMHAQVTGCAA